MTGKTNSIIKAPSLDFSGNVGSPAVVNPSSYYFKTDILLIYSLLVSFTDGVPKRFLMFLCGIFGIDICE